MANTLIELKQAKAAKLDAATEFLTSIGTRAMTTDEQATHDGMLAEAEGLQRTLDAHEKRAAAGNIPTDAPPAAGHRTEVNELAERKPWGYDLLKEDCLPQANETPKARHARIAICFGDYMKTTQRSAAAGMRGEPGDIRLTADMREFTTRAAAAGASEAVPSEGGFLVYPDFLNEVMQLVHDTGVLYPLVRKIPLSEFTNSIKIPAVDERARTDGSRWGGVQVFMEQESQGLVGSLPRFRQIELVTKKMTGLYYATNEVLADAKALGELAMTAYVEEFQFKLDDQVFEGTGAGQFRGISGSPSVIAVATDGGQATKTIIADNIYKMDAQLWAGSHKNAVWVINQDCKPQLNQLAAVIGSGGVPIFLPAGAGVFGAMTSAPLIQNTTLNGFAGMLLGKPVLVMEQAQTLGTQGDISLIDPTQYLSIDKGPVQAASSMHVRFLTDEWTFRWILRTDGAPWWLQAITPFHGTNKMSPFIQLASR